MDGQLESLVALDDWGIALQRIRDVVAAAETYTPSAFRESVKPLWQVTREAQARLLSALSTLQMETEKNRKCVEIEDENCRVVGWQEILNNGKQAARVSVIGDTPTVALREAESGHARQEIRLCSSCKTIVEKCPRCEAEAHPSPVSVGSETWTEFRCSSCGFRFPDDGKTWSVPRMPERPTAQARQISSAKLEEFIVPHERGRMSERPQWNLDMGTAQRECRVCFDKWQALTNRIRKMVEEHEEYAPDAFKASILELLPDYARAANSLVARLQVMVQIKCGEMRFSEDEPEQGGLGE